MGTRAHGLLFYGFHIESEEDELPSWLKDGTVEFDYEIILSKQEQDLPWEEREALINKCPIMLVRAGHYDYVQYYIALRSTYKDSGGWDSRTFEPCTLDVTLTQEIQAATWCREHGIDWETPNWILTQSFG